MKKYLTRPMALALSLTVLCGAMAAAALTGSPYEAIKDALFKTAMAASYDLEMALSVSVNGVEVTSESTRKTVSDNASINYYSLSSEHFTYNSGELRINSQGTNDGKPEYFYASRYPKNSSGGSSLIGVELSRTRPEVRLAEMALDLLVGDLRNSVSMSSDDGVKALSLTLTGAQIPEMYQLGLTVLMTQGMNGSNHYNANEISRDGSDRVYEEKRIIDGMLTTRRYKETITYEYVNPHTGEITDENDPLAERYEYSGGFELLSETSVPAKKEDYGEDPMDHPMKDAKIDYISITGHIGADGYAWDIDGFGRITLTTIFDEQIEVELILTGTMKDVGTAVVQCPIPGAEEVLTAELFESFGYEDGYYGGVYFTLNEDGTIDESSISAEYRVSDVEKLGPQAEAAELY